MTDIPKLIAARDQFIERVNAERDLLRLADFMAEAIEMERKARGIDPVGKDGGTRFGVEELCAAHCAVAALEAYQRARAFSNAE